MQILCLSLSTFDKVGGIQTFNKYFYKGLSENKLSYKVISLHDCKTPSKNVLVCNSNYFKFIYFLFKYSNAETIIIWQHITLAVFLPFLKLFKSIKINIITLYGTEVWGKKLSLFKKIGLMKMDNYWCISNYTSKLILNKFKIPKKKIKIFSCCINTPLHLQPNYSPYKKNELNILSILRLDKSGKLNAVFDILKILPVLIKKYNNIKYTIIGEGNFKTKIIKFVKKEKLEKNVSILGYVKDTTPYLEHCDIFTLTSPLEGFGIVYLEAMLFKKPCVSSKNCGSEDVVLNKKTGYSIKLNDHKNLAKVFSKMIDDKTLRKQLGKNGYNHLIKNFTFTKFKEKQINYLLNYS